MCYFLNEKNMKKNKNTIDIVNLVNPKHFNSNSKH